MKSRILSTARLSFPLATAIAALLASPAAHSASATYYWDDNAGGADFGTAGASAGTWAAPTAGGTAGWSLSDTGADAFAPFTTDTTDTLNFGNGAAGLAAGTVAVSGTVAAGSMTFASGSGAIALSGGTIAFGATTPTFTINNALNTTAVSTISSALTGSAGLTLAAAGNGGFNVSGNNTIAYGLKLSGTNSGLTGPITFNGGGTLMINAAGAWNNNDLIFNGNGWVTSPSASSSGGMQLNNNSTATFGTNTLSITFSGAVTGNGGITLGTLGQGKTDIALNNTANTFTGPVRITNSGAGQSSTFTVNSLADSASPGAGNITLGAAAALSTTSTKSSHNFTYGSGAAAPLSLTNRQFALATTQVGVSINNNSGQDLTINSDLVVTGTTAGKTLTLGGTGVGLSTLVGTIGNSPTAGSGTTLLWTGFTTTATKNITLSSVTGIAVGATITGTGIASGSTITGINPSTKVVTINNNTNAAGASGQTMTVTGVINSVSVTKAGTGTWLLSGANTYSGATTVSAGILSLGNSLALQNSPLDTAASIVGTGTGGLRTTVTTLTIGGLTGSKSLASVFSTASGGYDAVTALTLNPVTDTAPSYSGIIANGATGMTLTKTGNGTQTLSGPNTYTGATTVSNGTLSLAGGYLSTATTVSVASGAFLTIGANNAFSGGGNGQGAAWTIAGTITQTANGSTMPASVTLNNGTMSGAFKADFGPFLTNGSDTTITANGATNTINAGNLGMAVGLTLHTPLATDALAVSSQLGATAVNGGGLTKTGIGTVTLSGANTYAGNTTVSGGILSFAPATAPDPLNANPNNDASSVTIAATGATLNLTYTGTDKVDKLFIGGVQQAAGVYGPTGISIPQITNSTGSGTLTVATGPAGYSSWATINGATADRSADQDSDGVPNGVEFFIGGSTLPQANTTGFTPLPGVDNTLGVLSTTWSKATSYTGAYGADYVVETSTTLTGVWTPAVLGGSPGEVVVTGNNVKYTFPAAGGVNFARLRVTGP